MPTAEVGRLPPDAAGRSRPIGEIRICQERVVQHARLAELRVEAAINGHCVDIKSCESRVTLSAKISGAPFTGEVLASTYHNEPPTALFDDMAAYWIGWSGQKSWEAIDGELSLTATTTSLGKVTLVVKMNADAGDYTATAVLKLEAGSLDRIADDVRSLFLA